MLLQEPNAVFEFHSLERSEFLPVLAEAGNLGWDTQARTYDKGFHSVQRFK